MTYIWYINMQKSPYAIAKDLELLVTTVYRKLEPFVLLLTYQVLSSL